MQEVTLPPAVQWNGGVPMTRVVGTEARRIPVGGVAEESRSVRLPLRQRIAALARDVLLIDLDRAQVRLERVLGTGQLRCDMRGHLAACAGAGGAPHPPARCPAG